MNASHRPDFEHNQGSRTRPSGQSRIETGNPKRSDGTVAGTSASHWLRWISCLGWAVVIWLALTADSGDGPPPPAWLVFFARHGGDKVVHAGLFFVQSALLVRALEGVTIGSMPRVAVATVAAAAALTTTTYGVITEWAQALGGTRVAEVGDGFANAAGAGLAAFLWWRRHRSDSA